MVWPSIERDAMGGCGFGFWWCWCRRLDSTEREAKKERGREEDREGELSLGRSNGPRGGGVCDIVDFFSFYYLFTPLGMDIIRSGVCGGHFFPTSLLLSLEKTK